MRGIKIREQISFFKRLSLLLASGIPLGDALCILKNQAATTRHAISFEQLHAKVMQGQSFSTALEQTLPGIDPLTICMVHIGETHGVLEKNISHIIKELKKREDMKQKMISACIYPALIMGVTVCITLGIVLYLFPKVLPILASLRGDLPILTRALLYLFNNGLVLALALALGTGIIIVLFRAQRVQRHAAAILLRLPLLKNIVREYNTALIARSMGILLSTGAPLLVAIRESSNIVRHPDYHAMMDGMEQSIVAGRRVSQHFENFSYLVPASTANMIATGEKTGQLGPSLLYVANLSEESLDEHFRRLSSLIEPFMMIGIGIVVGAIALAIITPLYGITQSLYLR
ncbi:type II secretion system F family protein [Candidatus Uhrbacteria bacterium]|nr:type II secretion system F family protein [Candidatus Uhrbacteria bacterium]